MICLFITASGLMPVLLILLIGLLVVWFIRWNNWQLKNRKEKLETQIFDNTKELRERNEELEKNNQITNRLISIIGHDILPPLKFLHLASKNLTEIREGLTEYQQRETLAEISQTSRELELLSTNVLNWIKYRNEDKRMSKENFNLRKFTGQILELLTPMAIQKSVRLENKVDPEINCYQFPEPIRIILYNLILNGINFTKAGSVTVDASSSPNSTTIRIQDTGVGMSPVQVENILDDSAIVSSSNVEKKRGNGLGYLIIKDLLRIVNGKLQIRSKRDAGTTVTIVLQD